jgi:hypothetical protein
VRPNTPSRREALSAVLYQSALRSTLGPCRLVMPTKVGIHAFCLHKQRRGWRAYARHDGREAAPMCQTQSGLVLEEEVANVVVSNSFCEVFWRSPVSVL